MTAKTKSTSQIRKKRAKKEKKGIWVKLWWWSFGICVFGIIAMAATAGGIYFYLSEDLPKITSLNDYRPPIITTVYSDDNRKIAEFSRERRVVVDLDQMPDMLLNAFVAAEDSRFYRHLGVDFFGIARAFLKNLQAGTIVQGASTITQQVTRSFLLTREKKYTRKIKEAILAYRIDRAFTKKEVLFLYLNQIYLGHGAYGVGAAAENYFGKSVSDLNLAECALLAGLPQAPSRYSPFHYPERAKERQIYALNRMEAEGYINNIQAAEAINTKLDIKPRRNWYIEKVPIFTEHVRRYVEKKFGADTLYEEGLKVYTTVNIEMQKVARLEVEKGLKAVDKRQGYRGAEERLAPEQIEGFAQKQQVAFDKSPLEADKIVKGVVIAVSNKRKNVTVRMGNSRGKIGLKTMQWARKPNPKKHFNSSKVRRPSDVLAVGDVIQVKLTKKNKKGDEWILALEQTPKAQSALLSLETETGQIKVMVGGRDFRESQFNRAVQSRRQPGSAFKPIIYAAAIDKGYTPATVIIDSPVVYKDHERDFTWKPKNYGRKFYGPTLMREALAKSRNLVTIKILKDIGVPYTIDYARKLGITAKLSQNLSIALGSSGISLLEMVKAYSVFANYGYMVEPSFITKIVDRDGNVLEENQPQREKVLDKSTAYIMTNMMEGVVKYGTGQRIKVMGRPVAGKTGTSNDLFDALFMGFTPRLVTGAWVGFDEVATLGRGENGARTALPIWLGFMQTVLKDKPVRVFPVPDGVVFTKIDAETGLLPIAESKKTIFECFKEGTIPTRYTKKPGAITEAEDLFKNGI